jgi:hypothetical protein
LARALSTTNIIEADQLRFYSLFTRQEANDNLGHLVVTKSRFKGIGEDGFGQGDPEYITFFDLTNGDNGNGSGLPRQEIGTTHLGIAKGSSTYEYIAGNEKFEDYEGNTVAAETNGLRFIGNYLVYQSDEHRTHFEGTRGYILHLDGRPYANVVFHSDAQTPKWQVAMINATGFPYSVLKDEVSSDVYQVAQSLIGNAENSQPYMQTFKIKFDDSTFALFARYVDFSVDSGVQALLPEEKITVSIYQYGDLVWQ